MWKAGHTAAEIGRTLGKTRCAVIGYMHRHKIPKGTPLPVAHVPRAPRVKDPAAPRKPRPSRAKKKPEATPPPRLVHEPVPARGIPLVELREHHCRWPLGAAMDLPEFFCGQPKLAGKSYCPKCCSRAYQPFRPMVRKKKAA